MQIEIFVDRKDEIEVNQVNLNQVEVIIDGMTLVLNTSTFEYLKEKINELEIKRRNVTNECVIEKISA